MKNRNIVFKPIIYLYVITLSLLFLSTSLFAAGKWKPAAALLSDAPERQVMVRVEKETNALVALTYQVPAVTFEPVAYQSTGAQIAERCAMGNAKLFSEPGLPEVPYIYSRIVIPFGQTVASVKVIPVDVVELEGSYLLSYGEIQQPISSKTVVWSEPDAAVYGSDAAFPGKTHELTSIQYRCGVAIAYVDIFPVTYYPKSGKISFIRSFSLEVTFKPTMDPSTDIKPRPERLLKGKIAEENPNTVHTYPVARDNAEDFRYIIIAHPDFINAGTSPSIDDLIAQRESQGFTCKIESFSGSDENQLRNVIKGFYNENNTEFVCLVGDAGNPQKLPYFMVGNESSDLPLQCLDQSSWNADYEAEVFIGRISAGDAEEVSNQIYKILAYENNSGAYWTGGLGLGEKLDDRTYAKKAMEELADFFDESWTFQGLYDQDATWRKNDLLQIINSNEISIINHLGHSQTTYNMKLRNGDERDFTNTNFIFSKSQGCIPGKFQSDCIAERFTTENRNGLFAGVFNSNNGYYQPNNPTGGSSHQVHRAFWKACWEQDMEYFGEFNEYSHRTNTRHRKDIVESNLFGCPAIKFRGRNIEPFIRIVNPAGGEKLEQGSTCEIKWGDNIDGNVKIELFKGGSLKEELAASTESDGSFEWQIAGDYETGDDYKVKITSVENTALNDESDENFSVTPEYIVTCPYFQNFDTLENEKTTLPQKWEQLKDDLDWIVLSGPTPSRIGIEPDKTGPVGDHTTGNANYLYIEASDPNNPDKEADFITCKFDFKHLANPVLIFYYHMFSADNAMGDLYLDINVDGAWKNDVIHLADDHGDEWIEQVVDLNDHKGNRVLFRFRGITGSSWCGDICIDDIRIDGGTPIVNGFSCRPGQYDLTFSNSRIKFSIPEARNHVSIALYNVQGKMVVKLVNGSVNSGNYYLSVPKLAAGLYLCKMKTKGFTKTINVLITK